MVEWQELHIQSNLPLIVLAISFICVVIIGFLEFKKVSLRLDELSSQILNIQGDTTKKVKGNKEQLSVNNKKEERKEEKSLEKEEEVKEEGDEEIKERIPLPHPFPPSMDGAIIMEGGIPPMEGMMLGMPTSASMIIQG